MLEDELLIWKFKSGDIDALRVIYQKYRTALLKLAVVLSNEVNTAEDVVQDVFLNFAQSAARIRPIGNLRSYLMTSVANRLRNLRRSRQRHQGCSIEKSDCLVSDLRRPEQWALLSEELQLLSNAMAQIPDKQREVIALYMQGQMSFRQIAKFQKASASTIRGRYRYGLDKLRSLLNSEVQK
ncbi:MAG: RNA polymerase sigma factor [Planctomycetota bacterium]|jgi:RNA polymerase sigma-70 factor (ECF subfamily)